MKLNLTKPLKSSTDTQNNLKRDKSESKHDVGKLIKVIQQFRKQTAINTKQPERTEHQLQANDRHEKNSFIE